MARLKPNDRLGPYRLVKLRGEGGQASVWEARDERLSRLVALKVLSLTHASPAQFRQLQREAEIAARLKHENICRILEVDFSGDAPYIAMELVRGCTLKTYVHSLASNDVHFLRLWRNRASGDYCSFTEVTPPHDEATTLALTPPPAPKRRISNRVQPISSTPAIREITRIFVEIARAISYAHSQGVIHRDLKPSNIMVSAEKGIIVPVVLDFGLARSSGVTTIMQSAALVGTPLYMSPEQASGDAGIIGEKTDVYCVGATLYECLTGVTPFRGDTRDAILSEIRDAKKRAPSCRELNRAVPDNLSTIVHKAIEKAPIDRYGRMRDLADDLENFLEGRPILARPIGHVGRLARWARREPLLATLLSLALCLTGAGGFLGAKWQSLVAKDAASSIRREVDGIVERGFLYLSEGREQKAIRDFEKALDLVRDDAAAHAGIALSRLRLGELESANEYANRINDQQPVLKRIVSALISQRKGKSELAGEEKLNIEGPSSAFDCFVLAYGDFVGQQLGFQYQLRASYHHYADAIFGSQEAKAVYYYALAEVLARNPPSLEDSVRMADAIERLWDSPLAKRYVAVAVSRADPKRAVEVCKTALTPPPADIALRATLYTAMARALCHGGDVQRGIRELHTAVELDPENPDAHFYLGQFCAAVKPAEGIGFLERSHRLDPRRVRTLLYLARYEMVLGDWSGAGGALAKVKEIDPTNSLALLSQGVIDAEIAAALGPIRKPDFAGAKEMIERAFALDPQVLQQLVSMDEGVESLPPKAIDYVLGIFRLIGKDATPFPFADACVGTLLLLRARQLEHSNERTEMLNSAVERLRDGAKLKATSAWCNYSLGRAYRELGNLVRASEALFEAVVRDESFAVAAEECGRVLGDLGRNYEAVTYFNLAVQRDPTRVSTYRARAEMFRRLGLDERARQDDAVARRLRPFE